MKIEIGSTLPTWKNEATARIGDLFNQRASADLYERLLALFPDEMADMERSRQQMLGAVDRAMGVEELRAEMRKFGLEI